MNAGLEAAFNTQSQRLVAWAMRASRNDLHTGRRRDDRAAANLLSQIEETVASLDTRPVSDLTSLLAQAGPS